MLSKDIIRSLMDNKGLGMTQFAKMLGFAYPQKVTDRIGFHNGKSIRTDILDEMVRALGYKVIVVPESVKLKDGWYEVDDSKVKAGE